jgi:hemoglobin-like flavoprotein
VEQDLQSVAIEFLAQLFGLPEVAAILRQSGWTGVCILYVRKFILRSRCIALVLTRHVWRPGDKESFVGTAAYRKQAYVVMQTISDIVRSLSDLESITPFLRGLGARYAQYSIQPQHIDMMESAFFAAMNEAAATQWSDDVHSAWHEAAQAVKNVMIPALVQAHKEANVIKLVSFMHYPASCFHTMMKNTDAWISFRA